MLRFGALPLLLTVFTFCGLLPSVAAEEPLPPLPAQPKELMGEAMLRLVMAEDESIGMRMLWSEDLAEKGASLDAAPGVNPLLLVIANDGGEAGPELGLFLATLSSEPVHATSLKIDADGRKLAIALGESAERTEELREDGRSFETLTMPATEHEDALWVLCNSKVVKLQLTGAEQRRDCTLTAEDLSHLHDAMVVWGYITKGEAPEPDASAAAEADEMATSS